MSEFTALAHAMHTTANVLIFELDVRLNVNMYWMDVLGVCTQCMHALNLLDALCA